MILTELGHVDEEEERGRGEREPSAAAKSAKIQKGWVTKMAGLYREEPMGKGSPAPGLKFGVETGV